MDELIKDFVGYVTTVGVSGVLAVWLYFERQRAEKLQNERDSLLERTLTTMHATNSTLDNTISAMNDFKQLVETIGGKGRG